MSAWKHPIKAIIFDNDGVISDSLPIYYHTMEEMCGAKFDLKFASSVNGMSDIDVGNILVKKFNLNMTGEEFIRKRQSIIDEKLRGCPLVHGVENVIRKFHSMNLPMAVATSSLKESHKLKMETHEDLYKLFKGTICGDEVKKAKPDPEIFAIAASNFNGIKNENILVIEDSFMGIIAANKLGMATAFYYPYGEFKDSEKDHDVDISYVFNNFDNFDFSKFKFEP